MASRVIAPVLMMIALLLGGCGEAQRLENSFENAREGWLGAESLSFTAELSAELEDSVFSCTLQCSRRGDETLVEVLAPEMIAGIKARLRNGETQLEYDGLILAVGDPTQGEISPLAAMPLIMSSLLEGHVTMLWSEQEGERELTAAEIYVDEESSLRLWFEKENFALTHGELVSEGKAVVKCRITDFTKE